METESEQNSGSASGSSNSGGSTRPQISQMSLYERQAVQVRWYCVLGINMHQWKGGELFCMPLSRRVRVGPWRGVLFLNLGIFLLGLTSTSFFFFKLLLQPLRFTLLCSSRLILAPLFWSKSLSLSQHFLYIDFTPWVSNVLDCLGHTERMVFVLGRIRIGCSER